MHLESNSSNINGKQREAQLDPIHKHRLRIRNEILTFTYVFLGEGGNNNRWVHTYSATDGNFELAGFKGGLGLFRKLLKALS